MQRTQIYLPSQQIEQLKAEAYKNKTTLSNQIRILIDRGLKKPTRKRKPQKLAAKNWLLSLIIKPEDLPANLPSDLSENHDKYIYEI